MSSGISLVNSAFSKKEVMVSLNCTLNSGASLARVFGGGGGGEKLGEVGSKAGPSLFITPELMKRSEVAESRLPS